VTQKQWIIKRSFDIIVSFVGILATWWLMLLAVVIASIDSRSFGLFSQQRVGRYGKLFWVYKIKTMRVIEGFDTTVTTRDDPRITRSGKFFRKTKIDELPQLFNVFFGSMSFVGARPDVEGFADRLEGEDRLILEYPPGITGPASIKYKDEEYLLSAQSDPQKYNRDVIWPDKVQINYNYIKEWSFSKDIEYIIKTIIG